MADIEKTANQEAVPAIAGILQITPLLSGNSAVRLGPSAGWLTPRGIQQWEREVCLVAREDVTPAFARALRATLPLEQIAPKKYPLTHRAAEMSPLVAIAPNLAAEARAQGVRVHNVGIDRVSAGFFYLAEGGRGEAIAAHGNLIEMLVPSMGASASNSEIAAVLEDVVDRLLATLSGGKIAELDVELSDALPRLARDGTGLAEVDLDAFEARARALADRSAAWEDGARRMAPLLAEAEGAGREVAQVPLYGEATRLRLPPLDVLVSGVPLRLPALLRWTVRGAPRADIAPGARPRSSTAAPVATPSPVPMATASATLAGAKALPALDRVEPQRASAASVATVAAPAARLVPADSTPKPVLAATTPSPAAIAAVPIETRPATEALPAAARTPRAPAVVEAAPQALAPAHPIVVIGGAPVAESMPEPIVATAPQPEPATPVVTALPAPAPSTARDEAPEPTHETAVVSTAPARAIAPAKETQPAASPREIAVQEPAKPVPVPRAAVTPPQPRKPSRSNNTVLWLVIAAVGIAIWRWLRLHHGY
jgi:hypothetical protein